MKLPLISISSFEFIPSAILTSIIFCVYFLLYSAIYLLCLLLLLINDKPFLVMIYSKYIHLL